MSKTCKSCGTEMPDEARFCAECGSPEFAVEGAEEVKENVEAVVEEAVSPSVIAVENGDAGSLPEGAEGAEAAAVDGAEEVKENVEAAVEGVDNPSVSFADSSPYTGEPDEARQAAGTDASSVAADAATPYPQGEGFVNPQQPVQQAYMPPFAGQPVQQPFGQQPQAFGPQSEMPQPPHFVDNRQQPYGQAAQPAAQPQFVDGSQQYPQGQYQQPYGAPYGQPYGYPQPPKKSKKGLWIAIIAIILVLGLAAVAAFVWPGFLKGSSSELDGEWVDENGSVMTIGDGKVTMLGVEYNCKVSGGKIEISDDTVVRFEIDGDTLTLTKDDAEEDENTTETYTRVGEGTGIEGEWKAPFGFTMTFRGGKVTISGFGDIDYTYSVSGDTLTLHRSETYAYTLEGDKLTFYTDDEAKEVVAEYTRKSGSGGGAIDGPGVPADLVDRWIDDYGVEMNIYADGTGDFVGEPFTFTVDGSDMTLVRNGETYNYRYSIDGDSLYFYEQDGDEVESFYRYGTTPPAKYTGAEVDGDWDFDVSDVDYYDMYDAMIGAAIDSTSVNEATREILSDVNFKDSIRDAMTEFMSKYYFEFNYDGSVVMIVDPDDYRDYIVAINSASLSYTRDYGLEKAAEFAGVTVSELETYLNNNGLTWDGYIDQVIESNSVALPQQYTDEIVAQIMGGTINSRNCVEVSVGSFTQNGDAVTVTGPAGDVTYFRMTTDDLMEVESIEMPAGSGGSDAATSLLDALQGIKFVRG